MNALAIARQSWELLLAIAMAPILMGWIAQCRAWLQNRSAPPLLQPWHTIRKLFWKDAALGEQASPLFRATPYVLFGTMVVAAAIIPSVALDLPFVWAADAIALVGVDQEPTPALLKKIQALPHVKEARTLVF